MAKATKKAPAKKAGKKSSKAQPDTPEERDVFLRFRDPILTWLEGKAHAKGLTIFNRQTKAWTPHVQPVIMDILFERMQAEAS